MKYGLVEVVWVKKPMGLRYYVSAAITATINAAVLAMWAGTIAAAVAYGWDAGT